MQELASEAIKAEQAAIDKQNLFAAQGAGATEVRHNPGPEEHTSANDIIIFYRLKRTLSSAVNVVRVRRGTIKCRPEVQMNL